MISREDLDREMLEFFRTSVAARSHITGAPKPFEPQVEERTLEGRQFRQEEEEDDEQVPLDDRAGPPFPTIIEIYGDNGGPNGGTPRGIHGTNFRAGTTRVKFGNNFATNVQVFDSNFLQCTVPASGAFSGDSKAVNLTVYNLPNDDNVKGVLINGFTYFIPPRIDSIFPTHGQGASPGTNVGIVGRFIFGSGYQVSFGGGIVNQLSGGVTEIRVVTPPHEEGPVDVTVIAPDYERQKTTGHLIFTIDPPGGVNPSHFYILNPPFPNIFLYSNLAVTLEIRACTQNPFGVFDPTFNGTLGTLTAVTLTDIAFVTYGPLPIQFTNGIGYFTLVSARATGGHAGVGRFDLHAGVPVPNGYSNYLASVFVGNL